MSNNLPEGWKQCRLGEAPLDIIDGDRGINYPKQNEFKETGYCLFLNAKNVTSNGFVFEECYFIAKERDGKLGKGKLQKNDIVITTRGTVGNIAFYSDAIPFNNIRINSGMVIIRPKIGQISPEYTYQLLKSLKYEYSIFVTGSAQPQLPIRDLINIPILLPPLAEQCTIASVLSSLDDKIDLLNRENQTFEQMAKALFRQWFIEEADEKWEEVKLKNLVDFEKGKKPQETFQLQMPGLVPQVLIETFDDGNVMYSKPDGMVIANENDILIVMDGASSGRVEIGFSGIVGSTIGLFRKRSDFPYSLFLYYFLKSKEDYIREHTTGSAIPHADKALILNLDVKFSNIAYVKKFELITKDLFEKIKLNRSQIRTLEKLRDTLLPKLMSGEVRVKV